jgi:hypothetical protein
MFSMFAKLFKMFETLFSAGEKCAASLDNLATVGLEMSQGYVDKTRAENKIQKIQLNQEIAAAKA